jgi:cytoskeleton protein RodZ
MAGKRSNPEIRTEAFIAAREKCALSVERLSYLACLSKKQIQQIENGQSSAFYSPDIKFVAAKKVAIIIHLDEKDAFDFGPQAELPLTPAADPGISAPITSPVLDSHSDRKIDAKHASEASQFQVDAPIPAELPKPSNFKQSSLTNKKASRKKWIWLLPVGAVALLLVQFQPLLEDQLDAMMGKAKPVEVATFTAAPADATPANPPAEPPASAAPVEPPASATPAATPQVAPAITPSPALAVAPNPACPLPDASIENYKSPSPSKPGNMVYVKMPTAQVICVEDGDGKVQSKTMEPGLGHSFYGKPPFKLLTSGLSSAEIFFQGFRVRPSNADSKSILLVQVD